MTRGAYKNEATSPREKITMHFIEYDRAAPNPAAPWLVRTDGGAEWHSRTETRAAAAQLLAWIIGRQALDGQVQDDGDEGQALPEGAVII